MRIFVSVPCVESSSYSSCKVPHKTNCRTKSEYEIYDYEKQCSLEVFVLLVLVKIIGIDGEKWHGKSASTNSRILRKLVEKYTNKNCRPDPESPGPFFPMSVLYHPPYKEEKYDITEEMPESTMKEAIEDELSQESKETNRIVIDATIDNNLWIDHIE